MDGWRLAGARTLAWALWIGGWLVIGASGHRQWPLAAGGLLPLALWLLGIGLLLVPARPLPNAALVAGAIGGAAAASFGLWQQAPLPLAAGWALLVVAASRCVRRLRQGRRPGTPLRPAAAGALLAWAVAGDPGLPLPPVVLATLLLAAATALALLLPRGAASTPPCRAGLFDCALPVAALAPWRDATQWPQAAALLAMLPMMAALPALAEGCSAGGWPPRSASALHLASMLLPPLLLGLPGLRLPAARRPALIGLLLLAGGVALLAWPGFEGLMAAALLHGSAWGCAWGGPLAAGERPAPGPRPLVAATGVALLLLLLGAALGASGPAALQLTHALLAACGGVGLLATWRHNGGHGLADHRHP